MPVTNQFSDIPGLLNQCGIKPKKGLGQNFLVDESYLAKVVYAANILPGDWVLEIGAGIGNLTVLLAQKAYRVIAVETDQNLIPILQSSVSSLGNVLIIHSDILQMNLSKVIQSPTYQVVGNIPYNITSSVIRYLLESSPKPAYITLTVQLEVAQRICAEPGKLSLLALSIQVYGKPHLVSEIPAGAFYPKPKVDSATVRIMLYSSPIVPENMLDIFFRLVKAGFSQKRKTLRNSLSAGMHWSGKLTEDLLTSAGVDPIRRAQTLDLSEWHRLTTVVASHAEKIGLNR